MNIIDDTDFPGSLWDHSAVRLGHCIIFVGGRGETLLQLSTRVIWTYNLYTENWRKYAIADSTDAPEPFHGAVAAAINGAIYTFGGVYHGSTVSNALWTLSRTGECFTWTFIKPKCDKESPSPRNLHTGWEYTGNLWTFGGSGPPQEGYLNYHGDFANHPSSAEIARNNQLLCFDTNSDKWINPQSYGNAPSPRWGHVSAIIKNKVWIIGGFESTHHADDMFELSMHSLTWSQIQTGNVHPQKSTFHTLTALTHDKLVLHRSAMQMLNETWIMDLTTHSWRMYTSVRDHDRFFHTGSSNLNSNVIIFGGVTDSDDECYEVRSDIFHVMLEPKCLQQVAMKVIYKYRDQLPWKLLPPKLISKLGT